MRRADRLAAWAKLAWLAIAVPTLAQAMPGAISMDEAAVIRAAVTHETVVIETRAPELPVCSGPIANCAFADDLAQSYALANQRTGYIECNALLLRYERCVRRRQLPRTIFRGFPAVAFSRPGFSADGKTAIVHRKLFSSAVHGSDTWIFLTRESDAAPWRVSRQQLVRKF